MAQQYHTYILIANLPKKVNNYFNWIKQNKSYDQINIAVETANGMIQLESLRQLHKCMRCIKDLTILIVIDPKMQLVQTLIFILRTCCDTLEYHQQSMQAYVESLYLLLAGYEATNTWSTPPFKIGRGDFQGDILLPYISLPDSLTPHHCHEL